MVAISLAVLFVGSAVLVSAIINGFVIRALWGWFIVPWFHLPSISIPEAMGLGLLVGYMTFQAQDTSEDDPWTPLFMQLLVKPVLGLVVGWLIQHWL